MITVTFRPLKILRLLFLSYLIKLLPLWIIENQLMNSGILPVKSEQIIQNCNYEKMQLSCIVVICAISTKENRDILTCLRSIK